MARAVSRKIDPDLGISSGTKLYHQVRDNRDHLIGGEVLCIDPSCGSLSSMPGWAVYCAGELSVCGIVQLDPANELWQRLSMLAEYMAYLMQKWKPDILVYEEISSRAYGGRAASGHASLLKSVGVVLGSVTEGSASVVDCIGMRPNVWKKLTRSSYRKSDENDAIEMGYIAIDLARKIPPKRSRKIMEGVGA